MSNLRHTLARSPHPFARFVRTVYYGVRNFSLPVPMIVVRPLVWFYLFLNAIYRFLMRTLIAEPFFKSHCTRYGKNLHTSVYLHWISGKGDIILGDDILIDGKISITFAARFAKRPTLILGDGTDISHQCVFTIGKRITLGKHCMIAGGVWIFDSSGHPSDPAARLAGLPPDDSEVKPVTIGDNVWIGRHSMIFPGVTIGDGCIISAGAVVVSDVPAYTVVAGNPARRVGTLKALDSDPTPTMAATPATGAVN